MGFNIGKIFIIVNKTEGDNFTFSTSARPWDGFVLILNGEGFIENCGKTYPAKRGTIILLRKDDSYSLHFEKSCSYITSAFDFSFDKDKSFLSPLPFVMDCSEEEMRDISAAATAWQRHSWDSITDCRIRLLKTYLSLLRRAQKAKHTYSNEISNAVEYIHKNFRKNFQFGEISKYCSLSPSYLRSRFLKETGKTLTAYRNTLRISSACEMIESGHFSMAEIASELGFCDVYHFSKCFKKYKGVSPGKYKSN